MAQVLAYRYILQLCRLGEASPPLVALKSHARSMKLQCCHATFELVKKAIPEMRKALERADLEDTPARCRGPRDWLCVTVVGQHLLQERLSCLFIIQFDSANQRVDLEPILAGNL
jgi:hypothetical protein